MSEHKTRKVGLGALARRARSQKALSIKALAHPKRLLILDALRDGRERSVSELQEALGIRQSNVSQNLAILRDAGLVTARREAKTVYYKLRDARLTQALDILDVVQREAELDARPSRTSGKTLAVLLGAGAALALLAAAMLHPIVNGGGLSEIASHVRALAASPDLAAMAANCRDVAMTPTASGPA